jgi:hypothetical protein
VEPLKGVQSKRNIRLARKWLMVKNTPVYRLRI